MPSRLEAASCPRVGCCSRRFTDLHRRATEQANRAAFGTHSSRLWCCYSRQLTELPDRSSRPAPAASMLDDSFGFLIPQGELRTHAAWIEWAENEQRSAWLGETARSSWSFVSWFRQLVESRLALVVEEEVLGRQRHGAGPNTDGPGPNPIPARLSTARQPPHPSPDRFPAATQALSHRERRAPEGVQDWRRHGRLEHQDGEQRRWQARVHHAACWLPSGAGGAGAGAAAGGGGGTDAWADRAAEQRRARSAAYFVLGGAVRRRHVDGGDRQPD